MNTEQNLENSTEQALTIPVVSKRIELNAEEIGFIIDRLQWNINFAPEENTKKEVDLTKSILEKMIM